MCAYRAALTMDTTVGGQSLPPEARERSKARLQNLAKKAGFGGSWSSVERKASGVTPALIEQQLRANRIGDAEQAYKRSEEYKSKSKPRFHVEVGSACMGMYAWVYCSAHKIDHNQNRIPTQPSPQPHTNTNTVKTAALGAGRVFKEFPDLRELAIEAFSIAIACKDGSAAACHEMGDLCYDSHKYDEAIEWYNKVLAMDPAHGLAKSGIANCEKDKGNLEIAIETYKQAVALSPADPTFTFNLAQVLQQMNTFVPTVLLHMKAPVLLSAKNAAASCWFTIPPELCTSG